ncbi:MAG: HAMP domain-containing histidine kinase, partial [Cyclobacteriaceae bacterium]|nr:HAMP domain-containing histidine kinase [Cyclobacteriaceae bacterium]
VSPSIIMMFFIKSAIDNERKLTASQRDKLKENNENLLTTINSKETALRELKRTQLKLIESEKMASLGFLTAGIAHELNNPLNYVGGVVEPLKKDFYEIRQTLIANGKADDMKETIDEISFLLDGISIGTNRSINIIKQLSSMVPRQSEDIRKEIDLCEIIENVIPFCQGNNADFHIMFLPEKKLVTHINPTEINQVFINLIRNSIEAFPPTDTVKIDITGKWKGPNIEISIHDMGMGMEKETIRKAKEAFFTTKTDSVHTGLGLFIANSLLQKNNATLSLTSIPGKGTVQLITFYTNSHIIS